jgi:hypothetical protein
MSFRANIHTADPSQESGFSIEQAAGRCVVPSLTMSMRALALLMLFLLLQAGQTLAFSAAAAPAAAGCGEGCCAAALPGEAAQCCQMQDDPAEAPLMPPVTPAPAGQHEPLKTVWTLQQSNSDLARADRMHEETVPKRAAAADPIGLFATVPLTVLHCVFLT